MKRLVLILIAIGLVSFSLTQKENDTSQSNQSKLDLKSTYVFWKGSNLFTSHRGTVKLKSGFLTIVNRELLSGEFVIDMTSISNREGIEKL